MIDFDASENLPHKPQFDFFRNSPSRTWDYDAYKEHKIKQSHHPPREKTMRSSYLETLKDTMSLPDTSNELKTYLSTLINSISQVILN